MKTLWYSSMVHRPPMPTPINTPTWSALSSVILNPDWRIACSADATAYWMKGSIFFTSRFSIQSSGLKSFTSPAIRVGNPEASKRVISAIPDRPAIRASQFLSTPTPSGVTSPTPVITTRRASIGLIRPLIFHRVRDLIIYQKTAPVENPRLRRARDCVRRDTPALHLNLNGCKNPAVSLSNPADDPFTKLAQNLGELETVIGERARPAIAGVREGLRDALACRARGDLPRSIAAIRIAMERLADLGSTLDPEEGAVMRGIAERFTAALGAGHKGDAQAVVDVMRRKAGDTKDDDKKDW